MCTHQPKTVGTGVLDCPRLAIVYLVKNYKISLCLGRTVEDACPYNQERANTDCKPTDKSKFESDEQQNTSTESNGDSVEVFIKAFKLSLFLLFFLKQAFSVFRGALSRYRSEGLEKMV